MKPVEQFEPKLNAEDFQILIANSVCRALSQKLNRTNAWETLVYDPDSTLMRTQTQDTLGLEVARRSQEPHGANLYAQALSSYNAAAGNCGENSLLASIMLRAVPPEILQLVSADISVIIQRIVIFSRTAGSQYPDYDHCYTTIQCVSGTAQPLCLPTICDPWMERHYKAPVDNLHFDKTGKIKTQYLNIPSSDLSTGSVTSKMGSINKSAKLSSEYLKHFRNTPEYRGPVSPEDNGLEHELDEMVEKLTISFKKAYDIEYARIIAVKKLEAAMKSDKDIKVEEIKGLFETMRLSEHPRLALSVETFEKLFSWAMHKKHVDIVEQLVDTVLTFDYFNEANDKEYLDKLKEVLFHRANELYKIKDEYPKARKIAMLLLIFCGNANYHTLYKESSPEEKVHALFALVRHGNKKEAADYLHEFVKNVDFSKLKEKEREKLLHVADTLCSNTLHSRDIPKEGLSGYLLAIKLGDLQNFKLRIREHLFNLSYKQIFDFIKFALDTKPVTGEQWEVAKFLMEYATWRYDPKLNTNEFFSELDSQHKFLGDKSPDYQNLENEWKKLYSNLEHVLALFKTIESPDIKADVLLETVKFAPVVLQEFFKRINAQEMASNSKMIYGLLSKVIVGTVKGRLNFGSEFVFNILDIIVGKLKEGQGISLKEQYEIFKIITGTLMVNPELMNKFAELCRKNPETYSLFLRASAESGVFDFARKFIGNALEKGEEFLKPYLPCMPLIEQLLVVLCEKAIPEGYLFASSHGKLNAIKKGLEFTHPGAQTLIESLKSSINFKNFDISEYLVKYICNQESLGNAKGLALDIAFKSLPIEISMRCLESLVRHSMSQHPSSQQEKSIAYEFIQKLLSGNFPSEAKKFALQMAFESLPIKTAMGCLENLLQSSMRQQPNSQQEKEIAKVFMQKLYESSPQEIQGWVLQMKQRYFSDSVTSTPPNSKPSSLH